MIWENDPASSGLVVADKPKIDQPPFKFFFPPPHFIPDPDPATPNFRYWNAAEALRRGADFWQPAVVVAPGTTWFTGPVLEVRLDVGLDWNSDYDRQALNFYHGEVDQEHLIYASGSADLLCHELGHAMLDVVQQQLWHTANQEVDAFHESFGDISAILCALQVPTFRNSIMASTGGAIFSDSALSRIAEQFGTALHPLSPADAAPDCLRNAYNLFHYTPPGSLGSPGLTSEPHSFSRIFTGAVFEILAGMLAVHAPATGDDLRDVTMELRDIIVAAARSAPPVPQYYASVAAKMMLAGRELNVAYALVFRDIFVGRSILSSASANAILSSPTPEEDTGFAEEIVEDDGAPTVAPLDADAYGLTEPLFVEMPVAVDATIARSAAADKNSFTPPSPEEAARTFVDRLFLRGLVDYGDADVKDGKVGKVPDRPPPLQATHRIERIHGQLRLKRVLIHCSRCMAV